MTIPAVLPPNFASLPHMDPHLEPRLAVVIEDDPDIRNLLRTVLERSGFQVILTASGPDGIDAVKNFNPIVTTLDINMPGMDGFAVARRLREFSSTYLIMLTALDDEIDIIQGLEAGADDYLVKPFRPRELRARIEAVLRRPRQHAVAELAPVSAVPAPAMAAEPVLTPAPAEASTPQPVENPPMAPAGSDVRTIPAVSDVSTVVTADTDGWLRRGDLALHSADRRATLAQRELSLTRSEFDLLASLMVSGRRVRSKADLVLALHGSDYVTSYFVTEADKRSIEVHVANLRRKLGDSSTQPRWIETVRGVGYRLCSV